MEKKSKEDIQKAYLYMVKTPSSNDITLCASENKFYPGTFVVSPTRYGLDMGVVIGSLSSEGTQHSCGGCTCVKGACNFGHTLEDAVSDDDLKAMGEPPEFKFEPYCGPVEMAPEAEEDTSCWDSAYKEPELMEVDGDVQWISHMATPEEITRYHDNQKEEKNAIDVCKEKIAKHKLDMKLVAAHFLLSEPKVLFFFTAEDRVDFRELVKDLVAVFKMRIELRQIGVRDESRVLGGLAVCGRDFCCHCVSDKLDPVTIKMAKEQNLSLNSMKISGPCGRLLCCLSYEYDYYVEEKAAYPVEDTKFKIGPDFYRVSEINVITQKVTVVGEEGQTIVLPRSEVFFSEKNGRWEVSKKYIEELLGN